MRIEDSNFDLANTLPAERLHHKRGFDVGAVIGYDFGALRLETEGSYRKARGNRFNQPGGGSEFRSGSHSTAQSLMLNGLVDIGPDGGIQAYVGGGAGIARVNARLFNSVGPLVDDSDTGFAWQAVAGMRVPVGESAEIGFKYRFFNVDKVDLVSSTNSAIRTRWRSHSLMATLGFNFGGVPVEEPVEMAPPPPPPPPPPPAPPPMVVECNKGPYIVFFDWDRSDITAEAASILDSAATAYGNCSQVPVMIAGYADRSGSPTYNQGLSERRAGVIRGYLTSRGVVDSAINTQGFGETNNRVPTADGVRELQNRRVEITYGPGSGS